jgi:hypothetical protein
MRDYGWELRGRQGHHHLDHFLGVRVDYGMSGPNSVAASGSKECLFEASKNTPFDDVVRKRGIVVDHCVHTEGVRERTNRAPQKGVEDFPEASFIHQL